MKLFQDATRAQMSDRDDAGAWVLPVGVRRQNVEYGKERKNPALELGVITFKNT
jgi:hypothetical protein